MPNYRVTTFDICVPGFERMRSQNETIVACYVNGFFNADEFLSGWLEDARLNDECDSDFVETIREYHSRAVVPYFERYGVNPFDLEYPSEDEDMDDGVCAYLFIERMDE